MPLRVGDLTNPLLGLARSKEGYSFHSMTLSKPGKIEGRNRSRQRKRLSRRGDVTFHLAETSEQFDLMIEVLIRQKTKRYLETRGIDGLSRPGYKEFLRSAGCLLYPNGPVCLFALKVDEVIVATALGFVVGSRFYGLMNSSDTQTWREYSPGHLLMSDIADWCYAKGLTSFDFGLGDETYKLKYCDVSTDLYRVERFLTTRGGIYLLLRRGWAKGAVISENLKRTFVAQRTAMNVRDAMKQIYESRSMVERYRRFASEGLTPQELFCLSLVPASRRSAILDIGIGAGRTTGQLLNMFQRYVGIDYAEQMIAAARERFSHADLRTMDARSLKLSEKFDCVMFSFNGIDSVPYADRQTVFKNIAAALVPNGFLIYSTHNIENPRVLMWYKHLLVMEIFQSWPNVFSVARSVRNRLKRFWRQSFDEAQAFALVNDCGASFRGLNTYVDIRREVENTLPLFGFRVLAAIGNRKQDVGYGPEDDWVYLLAQKTARA